MASGTTHRSGTEEMFCVRWFETASSIREPIVARASHSPIWRAVGAGSSAVEASCPASTVRAGRSRLRHASAAQQRTKAAKPADQ